MGTIVSKPIDRLFVLWDTYPTRVLGVCSTPEGVEALTARLQAEGCESGDGEALEIDLAMLDAEPTFLWRVQIEAPFWGPEEGGLSVSLRRVAVWPDADGDLPYDAAQWERDDTLALMVPFANREEALRWALRSWERRYRGEWEQRRAVWRAQKDAVDAAPNLWEQVESLKAQVAALSDKTTPASEAEPVNVASIAFTTDGVTIE